MPDATPAREEHLAWAKARALEYLEAGDAGGAVASMLSDLQKHEWWRRSPSMPALAADGMLFALKDGPDAIRRWIEGFT